MNTFRGCALLLASIGLSVSAAAGCAGHPVRRQFQKDFGCAAERVERLGETRFRVTGCGEFATYDCPNSSCSLDIGAETLKESYALENRPAIPQTIKVSAEEGVAHREKRDGATIVALDVRLDGTSVLKLRANPAKSPDLVVLKVLSKTSEASNAEACGLAWMIDGQKLEMPKVKSASKDSLVGHQVDLPRDLAMELATAQRLALKSCDQRWSVGDAEMAEIRRFIEMYVEDLAWQGDARSGSTGGLLAPNGGWPTWKGPEANRPAAKAGSTLDGTQLFKLLSPSVFQVVAKGTTLISQGSAVAISQSELVTNCHVVAGAHKITLRQGETERVAQLKSADPATDRCVLSVLDATLTPVSGVRTYDDLQVGEALFTIGSPSGLELSLSNGLLSGRREDDGRHYVQTTAPVSPGSSGGGLFDARGNLVGITTKVLVGRKHLNQSLNFAIPADEFWKTDTSTANAAAP
jgi:hypothetical protein